MKEIKKKIMSLNPSVAFSLKITNTLHFKSQSNFYSCLKTGYKNLNPTLTSGVEYSFDQISFNDMKK